MAPRDSDIAASLLSRAHSPDSTNRIFTEKVKTRPLLLKPSEPANGQQQRRLERQRKLSARHKKQKPKPLSSRERRALCLYEIPPSELKYRFYEPLHAMWLGYIQEVLGENCMPVTGPAVAKLCSADFHGAELQVVRSRCVGRVGARGIVVKDSKFAFEIVTREDTRKLIPKEHTVFKFEVPQPGREGKEKKNLAFELHGNQFIYRAADRANRKFKTHFLPDL